MGAGYGFDGVARSIVDVVITAQITRVVPRDILFVLTRQLQLAFGQQLLDELGVMHDLILPSELGIFGLDGVQAVGAMGQDLLDKLLKLLLEAKAQRKTKREKGKGMGGLTRRS